MILSHLTHFVRPPFFFFQFSSGLSKITHRPSNTNLQNDDDKFKHVDDGNQTCIHFISIPQFQFHIVRIDSHGVFLFFIYLFIYIFCRHCALLLLL